MGSAGVECWSEYKGARPVPLRCRPALAIHPLPRRLRAPPPVTSDNAAPLPAAAAFRPGRPVPATRSACCAAGGRPPRSPTAVPPLG